MSSLKKSVNPSVTHTPGISWLERRWLPSVLQISWVPWTLSSLVVPWTLTASLVAQLVKNLPAVQETPVHDSWVRKRFLGERIGYPLQYSWVSLVAQLVKNPPLMRETWVQSPGWEDLLEKRMATHSGILAWRIPWTVLSMGSQRVRHDWAAFTFTLDSQRSAWWDWRGVASHLWFFKK